MRSLFAGASVALLMALTGCASDSEPEAKPGEAGHTMPDGTVMDGSRHVHDDSHEHGPAEEEASGPSEAARMVCTGQVVDEVSRIMGLDDVAEPSSSWTAPMFTCTFDLESGPLVLSVHDAADPEVGKTHFQDLRAELGDATTIKGVYSLGLPAYETEKGTVAFIREGKTLEVDATGLEGELGVEGDMSRSEIAYAVATSVLACWTEHS